MSTAGKFLQTAIAASLFPEVLNTTSSGTIGRFNKAFTGDKKTAPDIVSSLPTFGSTNFVGDGTISSFGQPGGGGRTTIGDASGDLQALNLAGGMNVLDSAGIEGGGGRTLLPSFNNIPTEMTTLFEAQQEGTTTDFENFIFDQFGGAFSGGSDNFNGQALVGQFDPAAEIARVEDVTVDNIGVITGQIMDSMPEEFKAFTTRILNSSSEEMIEAELVNLTEALMSQAELSADTLGAKLLSRFSVAGIGAGGAAIEAMKELGLEIATNTNAQIAQARLVALQNLLAQRELGIELMNNFMNQGATQRAQEIQKAIAVIDAKARVQAASLSAQAQVQSSLISRSTALEASRLNLLSNTLGQLIDAREKDELTRIGQQTLQVTLPWEVAQSAAGIPQNANREGGIDVGSIIGGVGQLGAGVGALASAGVFSDERLKENIKKIGELEKGINLYQFNYIWDKIKRVGVLAQEVEKTLPHVVSTHKSGYKMVDYTALMLGV